MKAEFTPRALKDLRSIDQVTSKQIMKNLAFYLAAPSPLTYAKKLTNFDDGDYRFRVGVYRIVFDASDTLITILRIQHRRDVYRGR